jgi:hypothetical protein
MSHKQMVQRLLQVRAHLILCFRAEPKIEMVRGEGGKMEIREKQSLVGLHGWIPITEKNLPYELTASFLLIADRPGVPHPIKLQEQHRALFPLDTPITEESGARLAAWASGGAVPAASRGVDDLVTDWLVTIRECRTADELRAVTADITKAKNMIPAAALKVLRDAIRAVKPPAERSA